MKQPFFARHYFTIMLALVFLAPFISRGARRAIQTNNNNVRDWLPPTYSESKDLTWFQTHFPGEQFALVSWDGCTLGNTEKLNLLVKKLIPDGPDARNKEPASLFKSVITGPGMLAELSQSSYLDYNEALKRLEGVLVGPRPEGAGDDARITCLVVTLSDLGKANNKNMRRAVEAITHIAVNDCAIDPDTLHMGGPPVDNVAIDVEGERTLLTLALAAGIAGVGLSYWCLRSFRLTAMVFAVGVLSAGLGLAMVFYYSVVETMVFGLERPVFGTVDAILMSMPAVVYVLGISGAIHLINYYRDARQEDGIRGAPETAVRHGWVPCTLAALTTALGLGSLYTSDILPIQKFGVFSAVGVLGTLAILFTLLPACLYRFPPPDKASDDDGPCKRDANTQIHPLTEAIAGFIIRHNRWVLAGWVVVMIVVGIGITRIETSVQLLKLFDHKSDIIKDYAWLERHLGNLVPMEVVLRIEPSLFRSGEEDAEADGQRYKMNLLERMELTRHVQSRIESLQPINKAISVATFAPQVSGKKSIFESITGARRRWATNAALEKHRSKLITGDYLRLEKTPLARFSAEHSAGHDDAAPQNSSSELWRINARVGALDDVDYGQFVNNLRHVVEPVLVVYRRRDLILQRLHSAGRRLQGSKICVLFEDQAASGEAKENSQALLLWKLLKQAGATAKFINLAQLATEETHQPELVETYRAALAGQDCVVIATADMAYDSAKLLDRAKLVVDVARRTAESDPSDASVAAVYTGVIPLVYKTQRQLIISLRESIACAAVLIALVMMCVLKSAPAGLVSMIPNVFPIVIVFGSLGWLGIHVDIGIMMCASVALGVAVDDTIHFLTWFRRGMNEGLNRQEATMLAYQRCAKAMFQTTVIGGVGLAVFALSSFTPTQQFGYLMFTMLSVALVGDLLVLPAILSGPGGKFFGSQAVKPAKEAPDELLKPHTPATLRVLSAGVRHDAPHHRSA